MRENKNSKFKCIKYIKVYFQVYLKYTLKQNKKYEKIQQRVRNFLREHNGNSKTEKYSI